MQGKRRVLRLMGLLMSGLIGVGLIVYLAFLLVYVYQWPRGLIVARGRAIERAVLQPWHRLNVSFDYYPKPRSVVVNDFGAIPDGFVTYGILGKVLLPVSVSEGGGGEFLVEVVGHRDHKIAIDKFSSFYNIGRVMEVGWREAKESLVKERIQASDWLYLVWIFEESRGGVAEGSKLADWVWGEPVNAIVLVGPQDRVYGP